MNLSLAMYLYITLNNAIYRSWIYYKKC